MLRPTQSLLLALSVAAGATTGSSAEPAAASTAAEKRSDWQLTVSAPREDGTKSVSATLRADAPIPSGFSQVTPRLVLRYRAGEASAFVVFDTFLGEGEIEATVTFGAEPPEAQTWTISSDGQAAFIPGDTLAFVERLRQVNTLSVRITPRKRTPVTVTFTPRDTDLLLKALISAGVKYGG